jgi:hypothetical protein
LFCQLSLTDPVSVSDLSFVRRAAGSSEAGDPFCKPLTFLRLNSKSAVHGCIRILVAAINCVLKAAIIILIFNTARIAG